MPRFVGSTELGGAAAALLGIAVGVNHYLKTESPIVFPTEGRYEWQWAVDGRIGYIEVRKNVRTTKILGHINALLLFRPD